MSKHTPGPWEWYGPNLLCGGERQSEDILNAADDGRPYGHHAALIEHSRRLIRPFRVWPLESLVVAMSPGAWLLVSPCASLEAGLPWASAAAELAVSPLR
mgnify:CR=1 FL=1